MTARPLLLTEPPKVSVPVPSLSNWPLPSTWKAPEPEVLNVPVKAVSLLLPPTRKIDAPSDSVPEPASEPTRWWNPPVFTLAVWPMNRLVLTASALLRSKGPKL